MLNKVMLIGNLGAEPEVKNTQTGKQFVSLSLATTERYKDASGDTQETTTWHKVVAWNRLADICGQYLHKGSKVYIEGKIQTRKYQDKEGKDCYSTEIVASEMKMLDSRQQNSQTNQGQSGGYPSSGNFQQDNNAFFASNNTGNDLPF